MNTLLCSLNGREKLDLLWDRGANGAYLKIILAPLPVHRTVKASPEGKGPSHAPHEMCTVLFSFIYLFIYLLRQFALVAQAGMQWHYLGSLQPPPLGFK